MANVRGGFEAPASGQTSNDSGGDKHAVKKASKGTEKQRLKREENARLKKTNLEKECVKKQILEVCNGLKLGNSNDIVDVTAIQNLCQLLKQLAVLSDLKLDSDITESSQDFSCLLKLLKTHRYGYCNITTCCEILEHILQVSGLPYSAQSQAKLLKELSNIWITQASYDNAITTTEQLAKLASELRDKKLEAKAYHLLFKTFVLKGSMENAKLALEKCVQCSEASEDELTIGYSKLATATLFYLEQNYEKALAEEEKFLEIAKRLNNKLAECEVTLNMGTIYCTTFNIQKALNLYSKGLKLARELGHRKKELETQVNQTSVYSLMGEYKKSYNIGKQMVKTLKNYEDKAFEYTVFCNLSVDALILNKDEESLKLAQDSLVVAEQLDAGEPIALAYGNIGLAQEKLRDYNGAIKSYEQCLANGEKINDPRIVNNSYCNLGRAYEGRGDKAMAKKNYLKALNMPQPPSSHWCDTEDFRFSPDYLLARLAVEENDYSTAKKYFQQVVDRCEKFRKSVHDSPLKICFNDTQKKPFQYLQHVLLKDNADAAALLVGEMGRGRDFYDKVIKEDESKQLNTPEALLDIAKTNNQAVLFLSKLDVVQEMQTWFITPDGQITSFSHPLDQWEDLLKDLLTHVVFSDVMNGQTQTHQLATQMAQPSSEGATDMNSVTEVVQPNSESGNSPAAQPSRSCTIEFRGVDTRIVSDDESGAESEDDYEELGEENQNNGNQSGVKLVYDANNDKARGQETNGDNTRCTPNLTATRGQNIPPNIPDFPDLIDKFSELIVRPIENHLKNLVTESGCKPELLIIPQGQTFNIPYSTLHLQNGEPLCSLVSPREAFSFHSYSYSMTLQQETKSQLFQMKDVLIVGNPTTINYKNLPFAQKEAEMIAEKLGVKPLLKDFATRSEVLHCLSQAPLIHFACHGTMDGRSLVLAPEQLGNNNAEVAKETYLTVEDISNLTLQANMVVLSACHTARGKISSEGVLGLARAFLMAGAKSVVTALWAVNDDATKKFMLKFYNNLFLQPVVNALATAMCEMKQENFKVAQWGSFKVLGANVKVLPRANVKVLGANVKSHFSDND